MTGEARHTSTLPEQNRSYPTEVLFLENNHESRTCKGTE